MRVEDLLIYGKSHCHSTHAKILLAELLEKNPLELLLYLDEEVPIEKVNLFKQEVEALEKGTYNKVKVIAPFVSKNKAEVVKAGLALKTPYELTWSCYEGGEKPCGTCGTCIDRAKAFEANGVKDPAI